ncbi:hypothetical protein RF11_12076 [Thelohanellus kitauei]|uniref:Uncharacterized protein n=1 Tax=Thelohanellus kitauei TaxID=669202 RepID=A0A0C2IAR9_THEKT|nr:hypothetical protein RF11_12076 [Thelohanellus kitauei]
MSDCQNGLCEVRFLLPCVYLRNIYFSQEWFATLAGNESYKPTYRFQYFITLNGGKLWKRAPYHNSSIKTLNDGGIIFDLNQTDNKAAYSLDEGNTYYRFNIFNDDEIIIDGRILGSAKNERLLIFARNLNKSVIAIAHVDFTNILS